MFISNGDFRVIFSPYAEKHFCKDFGKKYRGKPWVETRRTIVATLERAAAFQSTDLIDVLRFSHENHAGIFKLDFRVAGTNVSPKGSGNRVIFSLSNVTSEVIILLVYAKTHCDKRHSETQWALEQVKSAFSEWKQYC